MSKTPYIVSFLFFVITMSIIHYIFMLQRKSYLYDDAGCLVDEDGTRIKEPIYRWAKRYDMRGRVVHYQTDEIIGWNQCIRPMNIVLKYSISLFLTTIIAASIKEMLSAQYQKDTVTLE